MYFALIYYRCQVTWLMLLRQSGVYNFSNIRYAAAPIGTLRFQPPRAPPVNASTIDTGDVGRMCPQAVPVWLAAMGEPFVADYLNGHQFNGSLNISSYGYTPLPLDPRTTEDCLFLDVLTPQSVFDEGSRAPVLVWIYGGGYTSGDKSGFDGAPLVSRSMLNGGDGIIYVALNYRVRLLLVFNFSELLMNRLLWSERESWLFSITYILRLEMLT